MLYPIRSDRLGDRQVALEFKALSRPKILVDGAPVSHAARRNQFIVKLDEHSEAIIELRQPYSLDPLPTVTVDGRTVKIARPLAWYEHVLICLPLVLIVLGGAIGGAIGGFTLVINGRIMRSDLTSWQRYLAAVGMTIAAFVIWLAIVFLIRNATGV
jgi:hypothetical protein